MRDCLRNNDSYCYAMHFKKWCHHSEGFFICAFAGLLQFRRLPWKTRRDFFTKVSPCLYTCTFPSIISEASPWFFKALFKVTKVVYSRTAFVVQS